MSRKKQPKEYQDERQKKAREEVLKHFGRKGLSLLRKKSLHGVSEQLEIASYLVKKGFSYREIGRLAKRTSESIWYLIKESKKRKGKGARNANKGPYLEIYLDPGEGDSKSKRKLIRRINLGLILR